MDGGAWEAAVHGVTKSPTQLIDFAFLSLFQYCCLGNPTDRGAWWATVHGFAKSRTRLSDFTHTHTTVNKTVVGSSNFTIYSVGWRKTQIGNHINSDKIHLGTKVPHIILHLEEMQVSTLPGLALREN